GERGGDAYDGELPEMQRGDGHGRETRGNAGGEPVGEPARQALGHAFEQRPPGRDDAEDAGEAELEPGRERRERVEPGHDERGGREQRVRVRGPLEHARRDEQRYLDGGARGGVWRTDERDVRERARGRRAGGRLSAEPRSAQ